MRYVDRWYFRCVRDSMKTDIAANRPFHREDYISTKQLIALQEVQRNRCYYCNVFMNWVERRKSKNGLTIERLRTDLPHLKTNCVLACKSCNSTRYSRDRGLLKRYFSLWRDRTFDIEYTPTNRTCTYVQ